VRHSKEAQEATAVPALFGLAMHTATSASHFSWELLQVSRNFRILAQLSPTHTVEGISWMPDAKAVACSREDQTPVDPCPFADKLFAPLVTGF